MSSFTVAAMGEQWSWPRSKMLALLWPANEDSYRCMMGVVTIQASLVQVHICTDGRVTGSQSMRSLKTACLYNIELAEV